jgi:hypothetical protein
MSSPLFSTESRLYSITLESVLGTRNPAYIEFPQYVPKFSPPIINFMFSRLFSRRENPIGNNERKMLAAE